MIPYYKNDNFDEGILNGYKALYKEIAAVYNYDTDVEPTTVSDGIAVDNEDAIPGMMFVEFIAMFASAFISRKKRSQKILMFVILETIIIVLGFVLGGVGTLPWFILIGFFTIMNLIISFGEPTGGGSHSGHSWSSGGPP